MNLPLLIHHHYTRHKEDLSFWLELASITGDPILELGCGSGRLLLPLAQVGQRVFGIDQNHARLVLQRQIEPARTTTLIQGDMTCFHLELSFSLIFLACNTYSTLNIEQRFNTLQSVHRHLRPGGFFAFSVPNLYALRNKLRDGEPEIEEIIPHPLDGNPVQVSSAWQQTAGEFILQWHYDHLLPDGRVERQTDMTKHHLVSPQAYRKELRHAGFKTSHIYGDFDRSPYRQVSPYLILVTTKDT